VFLQHLEAVFGRPALEGFLRQFLDEHPFGTISTEVFVRELKAKLLAKDPSRGSRFPVDQWVYGAGLPPGAPKASAASLEPIVAEAQKWTRGGPGGMDPRTTSGWSPLEWVYALRSLPAKVDPAVLREMDRTFHLTETQDPEVLTAWLVVSIRNHYHPADARLESFLLEMGRWKYLEVLYGALAATPEGLTQARAIYARAKPRYQALMQQVVEGILAAASPRR